MAKGSTRRAKRGHLNPQRTFGFKRREGHRAGRPRKPGAKLGHWKREELAARHPVHVVLKLQSGLPTLRSKRPYKVLRVCFAKGCDRFGFRLNHYSVQGDHLHLIVEAEDRRALSRGMRGLTIRIAKNLNRLWGRRGAVFADRYYDHVLKTPREVRNALQYVLGNRRKHRVVDERVIDIFTSGMWFDGWRELDHRTFEVSEPPAVTPARSWLQRVGWRSHGLISVEAA